MDAPRAPPSRWERLVGATAVARPLHGLARAGFVAKALLYAVIGTYALRASLGRGGATLDVKGAIVSLADARTGMAALVLTAAALAGLGAWFVVEAAANTGHARGAWGVVSRVGQAVGGVAYVAVAAAGLRVAGGGPAGPTGDELAHEGIAQALRAPGGPVVAALVGATGIAVGLRQVHLGLTRRFLRSLDLSPASLLLARLAARLGTIGFVVQGGLFALAGLSIVQATWRASPSEAAATGGILGALLTRPYGRTRLCAASAGLLAYAIYAGIEGAFRRFPRRGVDIFTRDRRDHAAPG
jgi:hypothetical protein